MQFTTLGRTGLEVSVVGLGGGGASRLGLGSGKSKSDAIRVIRRGLDLGVNFIDMGGAIYATEVIVGEALSGCRSEVILSTKANLGPPIWNLGSRRAIARFSARIGAMISYVASGRVIEDRLDASLRELKTDYVDVFHLHAVTPNQYDVAIARVYPRLLRLKEAGKLRAISISETLARDPSHEVLRRAVSDGPFDCIMIGFNVANQSGAEIIARAKRREIGSIAMDAVGRWFSSRQGLQDQLDRLASRGAVAPEDADAGKVLRFLDTHGVASLTEAAYRFSRHNSGADIVLTGTGDVRHLEANIAACTAPPLPDEVTAELTRIFTPAGRSAEHKD